MKKSQSKPNSTKWENTWKKHQSLKNKNTIRNISLRFQTSPWNSEGEIFPSPSASKSNCPDAAARLLRLLFFRRASPATMITAAMTSLYQLTQGLNLPLMANGIGKLLELCRLLGVSFMSWFQNPPPPKKQTHTQTSEARQRYPSHMPNLENLQSKHGKDTKKLQTLLLSEALLCFQTSFLVSTCQVAGVQHCHAIATIVGWIQPPQKESLRSLHLVFCIELAIACFHLGFSEKSLIQLSFICWCLYVGTNHSISILFCNTHRPSLCLQVCVSKGFFSQTLASCNFRLHWNSVQNSDSDWNVEGVNWVKGGKTDQIISWGQKDWHLLKLIAFNSCLEVSGSVVVCCHMQLFISLLLVSFRLKSGELEQAKSTMKIPKIAACLDVLDADLFVIINLSLQIIWEKF